MTNWIPEHAQEPESSGDSYLKIPEGETINVRIIGSWDKGLISGFEVWEEVDGKRVPSRYRDKAGIPEGNYLDKPRFFWAVLILHEGKRKIWQINQAGIRKTITAYAENDKYGDPRGYDLVISRQGSGLDTEYLVVANPPEKLSVEDSASMTEALNTVNVDALYAGEDPFDTGSSETAGDEVPW